MGLETLPNGQEYFRLSVELEQFLDLIWTAFSPLNMFILLLTTVFFIGMMVIYTMSKGLRVASND